jgi:hypothetical protein
MQTVTMGRGIRRPSWPAISTSAEWILPGQSPGERQRDEHDGKEERQQHAGVHVPERARKPPPPRAWPLQERRIHEPAHQKQRADRADDLCAFDASPPQQSERDDAQHRADRYTEGSLRVARVLHEGCSEAAPQTDVATSVRPGAPTLPSPFSQPGYAGARNLVSRHRQNLLHVARSRP